jgi:hypothetical protein
MAGAGQSQPIGPISGIPCRTQPDYPPIIGTLVGFSTLRFSRTEKMRRCYQPVERQSPVGIEVGWRSIDD